jgi:hypothetical protein
MFLQLSGAPRKPDRYANEVRSSGSSDNTPRHLLTKFKVAKRLYRVAAFSTVSLADFDVFPLFARFALLFFSRTAVRLCRATTGTKRAANLAAIATFAHGSCVFST